MKTILAIWHAGNRGKSSVLREFAKQMLETYPGYESAGLNPVTIPEKGEFRIAFKIKGKVIGITTQGDPGTDLEKRLNELITDYGCDIILCSCRTRGETPQAVDSVATEHGFKTIWTSTYQIDGKENQQKANRLQGKQLVELLQQLGLV